MKRSLLFVIDTLVCGGAQRIFTFLANSLSDKGFDVTVLSYADSSPNFALNSNLSYIPGSDYKGRGVFRHLRKISFIRKNVKKVKPDLIICFAPIPAILSSFACSFMKVPVVFCERGDPYQYDKDKIRVLHGFLKHCDFFVFQTEGARNYYCSSIQTRSVVIPNPVTLDAEDCLPVEQRKDKISFVARFHIKQKRQDLMVEAFRLFCQSNDSVNLFFYGDGDDIEIVKKLVAQYKLTNRVYFVGKVNNVIESIKDSKLFVLTSDYEGIPNSLIEAMSIGLPCISTDCSPGGARLLIKDGINGYIVPTNDPEALCKKMLFVFDNYDEASIVGTNAKNIRDDYKANNIIEMWVSSIEKFLSNRKQQ